LLDGTNPARAASVVSEAGADVESIAAEVRAVVDRLRPSTLDRLGLAGAIAETARDLGLRATIDAQLPETLQADVEVAALRIAQEALHNIARHSRATSCDASLNVTDKVLTICIADNGIGLAMMDGESPGVGLDSMRQRAANLGGTCVIASDEGGTVLARLPMQVGAGHDD
jgi:signal transduction histidine kinase